MCATRGEVGEISDPSLATPENLWYVRELELRASMAQIGLGDVRFLPYRDSGMAAISRDGRIAVAWKSTVWPNDEQALPFVLRRYCGLWGRGT